MIIEQIQNIVKQGVKDEHLTLVGVSVISSGHLLIINPRVNVPYGLRPSFTDRSAVREFSASSACRMRRFLRESMADYTGFITLTYPCGHGFESGRAKRDLKCMLQRMRRFARFDTKWSSFWFMEFQDRGSIHFHIFTTEYYPKSWVAQSWYEICGTEDKRHLMAGTRIEKLKSGRHGMCAYASKYAAKQSQKSPPAELGWVGRFWGVAGYRGRSSADVWLTPLDMLAGSVKRKTENLQNLIGTEIKRGNIKEVSKEGCPAKVFYCKNPWIQPVLRTMIMQINVSASLYQRGMYRIWPELLDDLTEDEGKNGIKDATFVT